jgi:hypothetical protein
MSIVLQGSTSGSVTLQEPAVAGTTVLDLPAVSGTILTTTSPKAGNVLQVVNATYSTYTSFSTSTFVDSGLTVSITPTSSSSKILVFVSLAGVGKANSDTAFVARLLRNSTSISNMEGNAGSSGSSSANGIGTVAMTYLDSPTTTSSTAYKVQCLSAGNAASTRINDYYSGANPSVSTITLMEIAA